MKQRSGALHRAPLSSQLLSSARKPGAPKGNCSAFCHTYTEYNAIRRILIWYIIDYYNHRLIHSNRPRVFGTWWCSVRRQAASGLASTGAGGQHTTSPKSRSKVETVENHIWHIFKKSKNLSKPRESLRLSFEDLGARNIWEKLVRLELFSQVEVKPWLKPSVWWSEWRIVTMESNSVSEFCCILRCS